MLLMPTVLEDSQIDFERLDFSNRFSIHRVADISNKIGVPSRSPGAHLSDILYYCAIHMKLFDQADEAKTELLPLRMALGVSWEEFLFSFHPEWLWQPGEQQLEGVWGTPDGIHTIMLLPKPPLLEKVRQLGFTQLPIELHVIETKFTWKSSKRPILEQWMWMHQGRFYCALYDCRIVEWHVCYVMGDYKGSGPVYKKTVVQFEQSEIDTTTKMIVANRDRAMAWKEEKL